MGIIAKCPLAVDKNGGFIRIFAFCTKILAIALEIGYYSMAYVDNGL